MQPKSFKNKIKLDLKNFFFFKEEAKITVFLFQWENVTWRKGWEQGKNDTQMKEKHNREGK